MWEVVQAFRWRDALDVLLLSAVTGSCSRSREPGRPRCSWASLLLGGATLTLPAGVELLQVDPPRVTVRAESS